LFIDDDINGSILGVETYMPFEEARPNGQDGMDVTTDRQRIKIVKGGRG